MSPRERAVRLSTAIDDSRRLLSEIANVRASVEPLSEEDRAIDSARAGLAAARNSLIVAQGIAEDAANAEDNARDLLIEQLRAENDDLRRERAASSKTTGMMEREIENLRHERDEAAKISAAFEEANNDA